MKLGPEHIGKKVRFSGCYDVWIVVEITDGWAWVKLINPGISGKYDTYPVDHDWELLEPAPEEKLPSQRIEELVGTINLTKSPGSIALWHIGAIKSFLDEQYLERKKDNV